MKGSTGWIMALGLAALFLLLCPYLGLVHDSRLYLLQALHHLDPTALDGDIFVKYGSQDDYTLFSPGYAWLISLLGAEPAAIAITLAGNVAFLAAAFWLARRLMPARLAWLAAGLLLVLPAQYGSGAIFTYLEGFATPRPLAQCLVLLSLVSALDGRRALSVVMAALAAAIHPIMALSGIVLLPILLFRPQHVSRWRLPAVAMLAAAAAALLLAGAATRFDDIWFRIVTDRAPYLLLGNWGLHDWSRAATVLATLGIAGITPGIPCRRLALGVLASCAAFLLLSLVGGDLLRIVIVIQGQPWRALWLATVIAILYLPVLAASLWQGGALGRSALLLLCAAWVTGSRDFGLGLILLAGLAATQARRSLPGRYGRLAIAGAWMSCAVALASSVAVSALNYDTYWFSASGGPGWLAKLRVVCADGVLPGLAWMGAWMAAHRFRSPGGVTVLTIAMLTAIGAMFIPSVNHWNTQLFDRGSHAALSEWRARIPAGSDVLWSAGLSGSDPAGAWLLLERPSFTSLAQMASGLFSRAAAIELDRRAHAVPAGFPMEQPLLRDAPQTGAMRAPLSCADMPVRFIVTRITLPDAQLVPAPPSLHAPFKGLKLNICP